ncbi:glycerol-3-phosphate dehydrogenase (FAD-dependent) [Trypanosoma grayi]|uniref:glycerol-3-phosphate dehydrogenase (FAD-dependent) n=1 Tax=Trypanosoma grayi TaxID=71804 RepID=UPI0004F42D5E|nr:glycerol-3-phosphate dehydrogenase (FAD-dependent) [Trypanosoma grayi]KEG12250.1 glycerol-3-phosphate dehydrogenase (FAD-dependent) [Trypanosoma grayi]
MGRWSRRFAVRASGTAVTLVGGWALYHRWELRRTAVVSLPEELATPPPLSRTAKLHQLESGRSGVSQPFDVLIIGGGAVGLYTAVDAAQRGLRVAVVDADDFGAGYTGTSPPLVPGAFPYVQRMLRQRDAMWLRRAVEAWRALKVWSNVAPGILEDNVLTLVPSFHVLELVEFVTAAALATLLSPFCGPWRPFGFVRGTVLQAQLGKAEDDVRGAIVSRDAMLDGTATCVALARTAEALGAVVLNYAAVTNIADVAPTSPSPGSANFAVSVSDVSAPSGAGAAKPHVVTVYARSIVCCAGSWADEVKQLVPNNALDTVPLAYERHQVNSYLVAPRNALHVAADAALSWSTLGAAALLTSSTSYSFSSVMVLPWFDQCVLIGPSVAPLPRLHSRAEATAPTAVGSWVDVDGGGDVHEGQRRHICNALQASGVTVEEGRVLSCVSTVVPILRAPSEVPWVADVLMEGCHISAGAQQPHVVHVYGGILGFARDTAEKVVDELLRSSGTFTQAEAEALHPCRTRRLALLGAERKDNVCDSVSPKVRVQQLVREAYAVRVVDVVARRTHVAYSSPAEALAALPAIAAVMGDELGWTAARSRAELSLAQAFIRSVTVS